MPGALPFFGGVWGLDPVVARPLHFSIQGFERRAEHPRKGVGQSFHC